MTRSIFTLLFLALAHTLLGQSSRYGQDDPVHHIYDRVEILYNYKTPTHAALRPYYRADLDSIVANIDSSDLSHQDKFHLNQIHRDLSFNHETGKGLFSTFYKNPTHFYQLNTSAFKLIINPIFNFRFGYETEDEENIYLNKRGIEIFGELDEKFYFYTTLRENQSNLPNYLDNYVNQYQAIRGQGNYKDYQSSIFNSINGYDYGNAQGYLGYHLSENTRLELGHGKHFIGNGERSLLLSDSGHNYFYLKFDVRIWKFHYQSLFAELSTVSARYNFGNQLLDKKYLASHYLSFKPTKNLEFGFFEAVIFSRENNFEFQYLNPVILYRTIEHQLDSPDNVLLGFNGKWNLLKQLSLYGQFLLDDINLGELFSANGWWGNKYGIQLGLKYLNVLGLKNLDGQVELNQVRPFTYSHWQKSSNFEEISVSNYSHYNQPLAHPLGANFRELILKLSYQMTAKINLAGKLLLTQVGRNNFENYGSEILQPNFPRNGDFGITQNQGSLSQIRLFRLRASYQLFPKLYLDLELLMRQDQNTDLGNTSTKYLGTGFRYNIAQQDLDY